MALALPSPYRLVPELRLEVATLAPVPTPKATPKATAAPRTRRRLKSPSLALGLTLATELPTLLLGPPTGILYAGESEHFWITGGGRVGIFALLYLFEKFIPGFGIGPLYALTQPGHFGASVLAYPVAFPLDLLLVLAWLGSGGYDIVDSWYAAKRANARDDAGTPAPERAPAAAWPTSGSGLELARF
ncbi:MAG: hypothetical protein ACYCWW_06535 [Deltaproteobacteria bacterium]